MDFLQLPCPPSLPTPRRPVNDGDLLLLAVLRTRAREDGANAALIDYLLDHVPPVRSESVVVLSALVKVRSGILQMWWRPMQWFKKTGWSLRFEAIHDRGKTNRTKVIVLDKDEFPTAERIRPLLTVFRS